MALDVVFFGSPAFAVPSLRSLHAAGHRVLAAVCQPDAPKDRGQQLSAPPVKQAAMALGIPVLQPARIKGPQGAGFVEQVRALRAHVGVVAAYGKILPQALLDAPQAGCVNLHASLLPRWRGASPIHHALLAGDEKTGVCLMRMVLELDAGGVFACAATPLEPQDTVLTLGERLAQLAAQLCVTHVEAVVAGTLMAQPQPLEGVTYAPLLVKEMGRLQLSGDAAAEARRVRAMAGWPGAFLTVGEQVVKVHLAHAVAGSASVGAVAQVGAQHVDVGCGQGLLRLVEVQPPSKKRMNAGDWARGVRLAAGQKVFHQVP